MSNESYEATCLREAQEMMLADEEGESAPLLDIAETSGKAGREESNDGQETLKDVAKEAVAEEAVVAEKEQNMVTQTAKTDSLKKNAQQGSLSREQTGAGGVVKDDSESEQEDSPPCEQPYIDPYEPVTQRGHLTFMQRKLKRLQEEHLSAF